MPRMDIGIQVERYLDQGRWLQAKVLIVKSLKGEPRSHWLLTRLSNVYLELRQEQKALTTSKRAFRLAPQCPLVLWDYANALDFTGHERQAIRIWQRLISKRFHAIAYGDCGEGMRWARALVNDCRYRIGFSLGQLGLVDAAIKHVRAHLTHRGRDTSSIYSRAFVEKRLKQLLNKKKRNI